MNSALDRLTARPDKFVEKWPRQPEVHHGDPAALAALLSLDDIDRLISDQGLPASSVTMTRNNVMAQPGSLVSPDLAAFPDAAGAVDARRVGAHLRTGHTLLLMGLHRSWQPLSRFCRLLSGELGHPLYAHAFLTPPKSQGFAHHWDTEAVFIVQTVGHKTWELHEPYLPDPLPRHRWGRVPVPAAARDRFEKGEPFLRVRLAPGDVLWVPRGWIHNGYAEDGTSLHISVGVLQFTRHWLLEQLLDIAAGEPDFRTALPPGLDVDGINTALGDVTGRLARWLTSLDLERAAQSVRTRALRAQSGPRRPAVSAAVGVLSHDVDAVRYVPGAVLLSTKGADGTVLHLGDHNLHLPEPVTETIMQMIDHPGTVVTVEELRNLIGADQARRLVRELIEEGVVAPV
ncbi:Cupin superfamily protein [Micromonospora citrea]|uniref:Cupin superfamily protein n=1 Tax=Micromonospora citrea TaxID=47855 RepID=A0A1C6TSS0_9ACTN|nr:cupin domain-containing protein [Micromonospora citrea]SCL44854.1 Cupin superfamily protein [Micromonospora citrea]